MRSLVLLLAFATAFARPAKVGPVADFDPISMVVTNEMLLEIGPALATALTEELGPRHHVDHESESGTMVWMRDYQLLFVRSKDARLEAVRYLSEDIDRAKRNPPTEGTVALPDGRKVPVRTLPLILEAGNLVSTGRFVFVTETVLTENATSPTPELEKLGYKPRTPKEVVEVLSRTLELPARNVVVLPPLPGEATGHVDLFVLALGRDEVMVPHIPREALDAADGVDDPALVQAAGRFLDAQARAIRKRGLRVHRLPMLAPMFLDSVADGDPPDRVFYSPANSLLINTGNTHVAFLPDFLFQVQFTPQEHRLQSRFVKRWRAFFAARGYKPRVVEAGLLARYLGLFRCVSAVTPS